MALSTMRLRRETVAVPVDGPAGTETEDLVLYGLQAFDIASLARTHADLIGGLWAAWVGGGKGVDLDLLRDVALERAPLLMAHIIALGAREPEAVEAAAALPVGVQALAVEKVLRLTLEGDGDVKKVAEIVSQVLGTQAPESPATS